MQLYEITCYEGTSAQAWIVTILARSRSEAVERLRRAGWTV